MNASDKLISNTRVRDAFHELAICVFTWPLWKFPSRKDCWITQTPHTTAHTLSLSAVFYLGTESLVLAGEGLGAASRMCTDSTSRAHRRLTLTFGQRERDWRVLQGHLNPAAGVHEAPFLKARGRKASSFSFNEVKLSASLRRNCTTFPGTRGKHYKENNI